MKFSDSNDRHVILLFIDGVGIGENNADFNPLTFSQTGIFLPNSSKRLPFGGIRYGLDVLLGVPGLPQSASGQTSIYTGINAAGTIGHHLFGFPNQMLRELLHKKSLFVKLTSAGKRCRFLNGFRPVFFTASEIFSKMRMSATTEMNRAAGLPFTSLNDIKKRTGLYHEYTNRILRKLGFSVPLFTPDEAAEIIVNESRKYHLLLYEYFMTDNAGHSQNITIGKKEIYKIEQLIYQIAARIEPRDTVFMVVSDHGNLEDLRTKSHTLNKSFFALWGKNTENMPIQKLTDVAPLILNILSVEKI